LLNGLPYDLVFAGLRSANGGQVVLTAPIPGHSVLVARLPLAVLPERLTPPSPGWFEPRMRCSDAGYAAALAPYQAWVAAFAEAVEGAELARITASAQGRFFLGRLTLTGLIYNPESSSTCPEPSFTGFGVYFVARLRCQWWEAVCPPCGT
jgi:hypothetical protein